MQFFFCLFFNLTSGLSDNPLYFFPQLVLQVSCKPVYILFYILQFCPVLDFNFLLNLLAMDPMVELRAINMVVVVAAAADR